MAAQWTILLSQGQTISHDNAIWMSNCFYFIEENKTYHNVGLH